ncbi:MAG: C10 family peptidase [Bacteroidales bacterium]
MKFRNFSLLVLTLLGFISFTQADVVEQAVARKAAVNFFFDRLSQKKTVDYNSIQVSNSKTITNNSQIPLYHVFTFDGGGFVIITADNDLHPIIGYSPDNQYSGSKDNCCFNGWMDEITDQIEYYRSQNVKATTEVSGLWAKYLDPEFAVKPVAKDAKDVEPLLITNWGQGKYYNTYTPLEPQGEAGHCPTGCVATSMAQVMFYYRYPETGAGAHGYNSNDPTHGNYGWQFADFGSATYKWDEMVISPNEANLELAELMYHCGVAVDMKYGAAGSGTYTSLVPSAIASYFKYAPSAHYAQRMQYSNSAWIAMITENIDLKKPLIYSGSNPSMGHAWNADGYQLSGGTTLIHFNWGWDGMDNGYFNLNNIAPSSEPNGFNQNNGIVRNLYPNAGFPEFCPGPRTLTGTKGSIDDGSSLTANYQDNSNCSWLIAPTDTVTKIVLSFNLFATESGNDVVTVYDGSTTSAPVLLTASGNTIPASVTSTSNRMLITFTSNGSINDAGFFASFKSIYPKFCQSATITSNSGTITDGSGPLNYLNNSTCSWTIQPPFGLNLNLNFTYFDLEPTADYLKVYDLVTQALLGTFSGNTLPPQLTAPSGSMYIEFKSNYVFGYGGFEANYSVGNIGFDETTGIHDLNIFPNPATSALNINFTVDTPRDLKVELMSMTGQILDTYELNGFTGQFKNSFDLSNLAKGIYILKLNHEKGNYQHKVVVQ